MNTLQMNKTILLVLVATTLLFGCGKKMDETKPVRKNVTETVFGTGELVAENTYSVTARTSGYVVLGGLTEGDTIASGGALAMIINKENDYNRESTSAIFEIVMHRNSETGPTLTKARNDIEAAREKLENDSIQYQRYAKLSASGAVSTSETEGIRLQYEQSRIS